MAGIIVPERASHWYYDDGRPCYELPTVSKSAKNPTRAPTVRDAKELNLSTSVTSFGNMLYKPALENWKATQYVLSALTLPRDRQESQDDFARRVVLDANAESRRAADFGTTVHAMAENYVQGNIPDSGLSAVEVTFLEGFMLWARNHEITVVATEKSFCNYAEGFGGRVDCIAFVRCLMWGVMCNCRTPLDGMYVIDWKTQGTKPDATTLVFYGDWNTQLSGYKLGIGSHEMKKLSVAISSTKPGFIQAMCWDDGEEGDWGERTFKYLRGLWYSPLGPGEELYKMRGYSW